jgi:hypothetical protein
VSNMPAWSFSSLTAFETCARRYYLTKVAKTVREPPTEATTHGNEVHTAFENAVVRREPLPNKYAEWQPIAVQLQSVRGKREAELKLSIDKSFRPVKWTDKAAWCRGIVDLNIENNDKSVAIDYKTGKRKPDSTQLMLFAALLFHTKQYLQTVTTGFVWLKDRKIDKEKFEREQIGNIWQEFMPRVQRMEVAYDKDKWIPQPSGLCRAWCPCTECEFNGKRGAS